MENILPKQDDEYKDIIDELGYSPKYFYEVHYTNIYTYKKYLAKNLKDNIEEYYLSNIYNNKKIDKHIEILNLLDLVISEKLISSFELRNKISTLPLKYLNITKYKINNEIIKNLSNKINVYQQKSKEKEEDILIKYLNLIWNNEKNYEYDEIIEKKFFIEEKNFDDFIDIYNEKDKNSMNIYGNYYKTFIDNYDNFFDYFDHSYKYIYVYQLAFSINFIENVFLEIIYNHIKQENLFFSNLLDKGSCGGIFELLLGFYIQKSESFLGEKIEQTIYISSLVPNNYSIIYYSSNYNKEIKKFEEFKLKTKEQKRKIPFKNTFIKQIIFNSKYYDMAILIKSKNNNVYKLIVIQATIMKDKEKRMSKDEHELILRSVKLNLENEFEIYIEEAYFIYVLCKKNGGIIDQETIKDCDENEIEYFGFDIDTFEKDNGYKINNKKAFITNSFPIHNATSLLVSNKSNKGDIINYLTLKSIIDDKLNESKELKDYNEYIKHLFKNKYDDKEFNSEQFKYFEIPNPIFEKNKIILNYLSEFSFLIFIGNKGEKIYVHFNKLTYNCRKKFENFILKSIKKDIDQILFCYSSIPLAIKNSIKK